MKKQQIFVVLGTIFIIVLFLFLPKTPEHKEIEAKTKEDARITLAVNYVENSTQPMKGVMMLREMAEKDPPNPEAIWMLGTFGMKSGQHEKALIRFTSLLELVTEEQKKIGVYFNLHSAHLALGNKLESKVALENILKLTDDPTLVGDVNRRILELK